MQKSPHNQTSFVLTAVLLLAFALRLGNISVTDYDLDEGWTHSMVGYVLDGEHFDQIYSEPNNMLHILWVTPLAYLAPNKVGFRFWSIAAGLLTVATLSRAAFRLAGRRAAVMAALLAAVAYTPIDYAQHVRPYALAALFATLAVVAWLERRPRLSLLFSSLVPFFHVTAVPILMAQDVITLFNPRRWGYRSPIGWIIYRILPYTLLLLLLYLLYLRRLAGKVMSSGQTTPSGRDVVQNWIYNSSGFNDFSPPALVFLAVGLAVLVTGLWLWRQGRLPRAALLLPLLWVFISYGLLIIMSIVSDGPIRFIHLMHIGYATGLLLACVLAKLPPPLRGVLLLLAVLPVLFSLHTFYTRPYQGYKETYQVLQAWRSPDQTVYFEVVFPVQALMLASAPDPLGDWLRYIPPGGPYPESPYVYLAYADFTPPLPASCSSEAIWQQHDFHLHRC